MTTKQEIDVYRGMVIDGMRMAGFSADRINPKGSIEMIWGGRGGNARMKEKWAFYIGQLYLLDMIDELCNAYTTEADTLQPTSCVEVTP